MENKIIRVTVWNEFVHERTEDYIREIYPKGMHAVIADALSECGDLQVRLASLDEPDQGLPDEILEETDVLMWWGHVAHDQVSDALVEKIRQRVYAGKLGFFPVHSGHHSKPFRAILGTTGNLTWGDEQKEILWNLCPTHPIAAGIPDHFVIEKEELYGEPFYIPTPDELIFGGWFEQGNIMRSCCTWRRGAGKIVYFQPGHESCRAFYNPFVRRILQNAVHWVAPADFGYQIPRGCIHQSGSVN